eukprot:259405-Chlamydomonas_euryale.AAC.1
MGVETHTDGVFDQRNPVLGYVCEHSYAWVCVNTAVLGHVCEHGCAWLPEGCSDAGAAIHQANPTGATRCGRGSRGASAQRRTCTWMCVCTCRREP